MQTRSLGGEGLETSAIGYGTMGITMAYGPPDEEGGVKTIRRAFELGVTMFDTAEYYGGGTGSSEKILGRAVRGFRDEITIATKFGFVLPMKPDGSLGFNSRPDHIREVVDNSLAYLGTGHIDLLYQHRVDPDVPIEEVAGTVGELVDAGKVKYFGLSEAGPKTIRRAHATHPVSVLQTEYSVFERDVEEEILPQLRKLGIGFVPYAPLGRGFLTSVVRPASEYPPDDLRARDERWQGENFEANRRAVDKLRGLAESKGATAAQLALAWLLAQGADIVPIPGTRSPARLEENIGAANLELTGSDMERIVEILPNGSFGARHPASRMPTWT